MNKHGLVNPAIIVRNGPKYLDFQAIGLSKYSLSCSETGKLAISLGTSVQEECKIPATFVHAPSGAALTSY